MSRTYGNRVVVVLGLREIKVDDPVSRSRAARGARVLKRLQSMSTKKSVVLRMLNVREDRIPREVHLQARSFQKGWSSVHPDNEEWP
jgi:hypothetical protein